MATLKDLAPAEKQKVARLIKQAVEREAAIRELEAALAEAQAAAAAAADGAEEAGRAAALEEQNRSLALENTSLRAKLTHAFDLLRTYQHKVRVLDATVAVAGAASAHSSRPITPVGQLAAHGGSSGEASGTACQGVYPQLLAAQLDALECGGCSTHSAAAPPAAMLSTPQHSGGGAHCHAAGSACRAQLSPVAEGGAEGLSPGQAPNGTAAAGQWLPSNGDLPTADSSLQLVPPGAAALPQLETLKMLAQALLEAQAEVAAKQQQRQQWGTAADEAPSGHVAQGQLPPATVAVAPHGQLVFDASLGTCGGFLISQQQCTGSAGPPAAAAVGSSSGSPAGEAHRPPLAALQQQQQQHCSPCGSRSCDSGQCGSVAARSAGQCSGGDWPGCSSWAGGNSYPGCGTAGMRPLEFGDDLLELVQDVENIGGRLAGHGQAAAMHPSGHWGEHGSGSGALYEENDVLLLLEQL